MVDIASAPVMSAMASGGGELLTVVLSVVGGAGFWAWFGKREDRLQKKEAGEHESYQAILSANAESQRLLLQASASQHQMEASNTVLRELLEQLRAVASERGALRAQLEQLKAELEEALSEIKQLKLVIQALSTNKGA
jgi:uncharacterized coiled-coil DUF342 family protein